MTEEFPPPPPPAQSSKAGWWCAWIFAAVVLPAFMGILAAQGRGESDLYTMWAMGLIGLVLHLVACWKLRDDSGCLFPFMLLGGWVLMAVLFFVGCVNNMRFH